MQFTFLILSVLLVSGALLPLIRNPHWFFRAFDFGKAHLLFLHLIVFTAAFFLVEFDLLLLIAQILNFSIIGYHISTLWKYTPLYKHQHNEHNGLAEAFTNPISLLSVNVYQFNQRYDLLIEIINSVKPQVLLTIESNQDWEQALQAIEPQYPYYKKVPQENTYGMHLYSKLPLQEVKVHYMVADDLPSIEARVKSVEGIWFKLFCVHPPPPSPSEEPNAKERDGEILSVARLVKKTSDPVVVVGDFNNVAWARSSILFKKASGLIDGRVGRGFVSTFHAKYRLLRIPIDLFFHCPQVCVNTLTTLESINSDHLPLFSTFTIMKRKTQQEVTNLNSAEKKEVEERIQAGKKEEGHRPPIIPKG